MSASILYLVRHAEAEPASGVDDAGRRLTAEGRERFIAFARALAPDLHLERVLVSPLVRARETAELLTTAAGGTLEETSRLAPGRSSGRDLLELGKEAGDGAALVGHNPEIAEAVSLAAGQEQKVPPGAVAAVEVGPEGHRLVWLRAP